jgi:hypothetical protein
MVEAARVKPGMRGAGGLDPSLVDISGKVMALVFWPRWEVRPTSSSRVVYPCCISLAHRGRENKISDWHLNVAEIHLVLPFSRNVASLVRA